MQFRLNRSAQTAWGHATRTASAFRRRLQVFDLRDILLLIAATVSMTFILSSLIFSTYYILDMNPTVLMAAVMILSILVSFAIILYFRIDIRHEKLRSADSTESEYKLEQSLPDLARIYKEIALGNTPVRENPMASTRFSSSLVRIFAVGVGIVATGLVVVLIGMATGKLEAQFGGSTLLAIGCVLSTLAVIRGESLDQQSL